MDEALNVIEVIERCSKVIGLIYRMYREFKNREKVFESCVLYISGLESTLNELKLSIKLGKVKSDEIALNNLLKALQRLNDFLAERKKDWKISKWIFSSFHNQECQERMKEIEKHVISLNLVVNCAHNNEILNRFDLILNKVESLEKAMKAIPTETLNKFKCSLAAEFWIKYFASEENVEWELFFKSFADYVDRTEQVTISDEAKSLLQSCIDENRDLRVDIKECDLFFIKMWTVLGEKLKILKYNIPEPPVENVESSMVIKYIQGEEPFGFPLGSTFKFSPRGVTYTSYSNKLAEVERNLTKNTVIMGRPKEKFIPHITFSPECSQISNKQCEFLHKSSVHLDESGFFITCLSPTNPTALMVEETPYFLNKEMIFDVSAQYIFRVVNLTPRPLNELRYSKEGFFVDSGVYEKGSFMDEIKVGNSNTEKIKRVRKNVSKNEENAERRPSLGEKISLELEIVETGELTLNKKQWQIQLPTEPKEPFIFNIGSDESCDIVLDDKEAVSPFHCQIVFKPGLGWIIAQKFPGAKQKTLADSGTFVYLKNYKEWKEAGQQYTLSVKRGENTSEKNYTASKSQKLRKGMKIFMSYHIFRVEELS